MTTTSARLLADGLRPELPDEFARKVLEGALMVLDCAENPIRLNLFAAAVRELFYYVLQTLAPDEAIQACAWFDPTENKGKPTRRARARYATQGGLDEGTLEELGIDAAEAHGDVLRVVDALSKYTHVRPGSVVEDDDQVRGFAREAIEAFLSLFATLREARSTVVDAIREELDEEALEALTTESISELDVLSTHTAVQDAYVDVVEVTSIGPEFIDYRASGTVSVSLDYGSESDRRRGEGASMTGSYPFVLTTRAPVSSISGFAKPDVTVDTEAFYGPDESAGDVDDPEILTIP